MKIGFCVWTESLTNYKLYNFHPKSSTIRMCTHSRANMKRVIYLTQILAQGFRCRFSWILNLSFGQNDNENIERITWIQKTHRGEREREIYWSWYTVDAARLTYNHFGVFLHLRATTACLACLIPIKYSPSLNFYIISLVFFFRRKWSKKSFCVRTVAASPLG